MKYKFTLATIFTFLIVYFAIAFITWETGWICTIAIDQVVCDNLGTTIRGILVLLIGIFALDNLLPGEWK